jgi:small-conductance mechanosensitive channel
MNLINNTWYYIHNFMATYTATAQAIIIGLLGLIALWLVMRITHRSLRETLPAHLQIIIAKIVRYGGLLILGSTILTQLGFNITALLGAAGVVGVAIGFASQTSISNIISGMFLIMEHPFNVGDVLEVGNESGSVESIDLLAVRLRTPDGKLIRIPNETLIKSSVVNKTFYASRRVALTVLADRKHDLAQVMLITKQTLNQLSVVKKDPAVSISIESSSLWTVDLLIWCWVDSHQVASATADITQALYEAYQKEDISAAISS